MRSLSDISIKQKHFLAETELKRLTVFVFILFAFIATAYTQTYYSYQSGDWDQISTWTHDPGGTTHTASTIPGDNDVVVILASRSVVLTGNVTSLNLDISISEGAFLDLSTLQFTNSLTALRGQGTLRIASVNFPSVVTNPFVTISGGTTEYYNATDFTLPPAQTNYHNLVINSAGVIATLLSDVSLTGNLLIKQGTFQINDNTSSTALTLSIDGSVDILSGASIMVGQGATNTTATPTGIVGGTAPFLDYYTQFHTVIIKGDFTNKGTARFTNLSYPIFNAFPPTVAGSTSGAASVYFTGATNNNLTCEGITDFYNLILDKGIDASFSLTIYSTAYSNFRLFGANNAGGDTPGNNPNLKKALWIRTGTMILKGLAVIPSLTEGACGFGDPNADFYIPANGALVLDGPDVVVLSSADRYEEINVAYGVSGGSGLVNGVSQGGCNSLSILGKIQVDDGYLSTRESGGFLTWDWASGQFELNGGIVDAKQYRAAGGTAGLASFKQTGGTLILRGRFMRNTSGISTVNDIVNAPLDAARVNNGIDPAIGTFSINSTDNVFNMSGGKIQIYDACIGPAAGNVIEIGSSSSNINVTGGTIELLPTTGTGMTDAASFQISTTAPFGNILVNRISSTSTVSLLTSLEILGDLNIQSGELDANNLNISIGRDFTIATGTLYQTGTNTTIINGTGNQVLSVDLAAPLDLNNLLIEKDATGSFSFEGTQTTININDSLVIREANVDDNGRIINALNSVYSSGTHTGTGKIVLNSNANQVLDGDGTGVFGNLELNKPTDGLAEIIVKNNISVNGTLSFTGSAAGYKLLNIQDNNLSLSATSAIVGANSNRYIRTNGNAGDKGISKIFSLAFPSFVYPLGAPSINHGNVFTPATISITALPATWGTVTIKPVGAEHPATTTKNQSLSYYWRVSSSGFTGLAPNSVTHDYSYNQNDVIGTESNYVPARYEQGSFSWTFGTSASVNEAADNIGAPWLTNTDYIDGEYTAGDNAFGAVTVYYSLNSGQWGTPGNWSTVSHAGPAAAQAPGASDPVIIGNNDSIYLLSTLAVPDNDPRSCASLQIEAGAALDIGYNPSSNFGVVLSHSGGNGNFRLTTSENSGSTFAFPSGDFSDFNVNLGTTELYTTNFNPGTTYWFPNGVKEYGNLIISPVGGSNIIFPNNDLTVYGDIVTKGQNADSWFLPNWSGNYPTAPTVKIAKTITVYGDLNIQGGALIWYRNYALSQRIIVHGDVTVAPQACIDVWSDATNQELQIGGSLINNTTGTNEAGVFTTSRCDFTLLPVTFFGANSASITNTGGSTPLTIFQTLTIDKGDSQATTLTLDIGGTLTIPTDNWMTLKNGTFIYNRTGNLTISEASTFTIPGTAGLLINSPSNVLIANSNTDNNDLFLNGKLTLLDGNIYVGPTGAPNFNNDIEYSGGGQSEIDIQGGSLTVNGQIRRNPASSAGILKYNQSAGAVIINGNNASTSNAKLEVLNAGSEFTMTGGTLTLIRGGGGNTYGDMYLRPQLSTVTGGEIIFTQAANNFVQGYILDATVPLNDLTVTATNSNDATVTLLISPLEIDGTLTLSNANSIFDVNSAFDVNVTINGDFDNSGVYNYYNNVTTFNGGVQSVLGASATSFYDLVVNPVTSLQLNGDIVVDHNLSLSSGTLLCDNYHINVAGNVINNATFTDNNTGMVLDGTVLQYLSGTGTFGNLELNNTAGARLSSNLTLQQDLTLTQGLFNINNYLLTLGQNSNINGAPFSNAKMITSDGVFSNVGIRKFFSAGPGNFTFPIGTSGKFTPADLTIATNTNVGYIRLNNINSMHPSVIDPSNALDYFWELESSGLAGFSGSLVLNYLEADVNGAQENNYMAARLIIPGTSWSQTSTVDDAANTIAFNFISTNNLSGEYTAGLSAAFPANVPEFTSQADGNWNDSSIWVQTGGDPYPLSPGSGPNGFIVIINNSVTTDANYCSAYRTTINDTLRITEPFYGQNIGTVDGDGTLYLESEKLPAGRYSNFLSCSNNSTLEYGGTGNYTLIADLYSDVPNLLFSGSGIRILPNKDLTICNSLIIDGPTLDNSVNNRQLTLLGSIERYGTGAFLSGSGAGATVLFAGSLAQTIGGATGDFSGFNAFHNLEVNNPRGLSINPGGLIDVEGNLLLTDGLINTSSSNVLRINNTATNCVIPAGGSTASYINGPLIKSMNQGDAFQFPIGNNLALGNKLTISATQTGTLSWTAEYHNPNSDITYLAPLTAVNSQEYWTISVPASSQANVNLKWDPASDLTPLVTQNGVSDMRIADYDGSDWNELSTTASGDNNNGSVETTSRYSFASGTGDFTLACINVTKPRARLAPTGPICGSDGIPITFSSTFPITLNYTLDYTINGTPQPTITVTSLPYVLPTPTAGVYKLTGYTYDNGAGIGVVNNGTVEVFDNPTTANAGLNQSHCGGSSATLTGNGPSVGSGLWTIVSGNGGTVVAPTTEGSLFNGVNGNTYVIEWAITNGNCVSRDSVTIEFPLLPAQPANYTTAQSEVCQNSTGNTFTVPYDATVLAYNWSYTTGTGASIVGTGNSVTVNFSPTATTGVLEVSATNGCGTSASRDTAVIVNAIPDLGTITTPAVCIGGSYNLTSVAITDANTTGASYTYHSGTPATAGNELASSTVSPSATTTYYILGTTGSGCTDELAVTVTVNPLPNLGTNTSPAICNGSNYNLTSVAITDTNTTGASYTYHSGTPATAGNELASSTVSPSATTTYYILGTTGSGCTDELAVTLTVNPLPDLSTITTPAICNGSSYDLTAVAVVDANSTGASHTYHSGTPANAGNELASSTVSPSTTTTYYLLGTTGSGCTDELAVTVTVNPLPDLSTVTTPAICNGSSYDLTAVAIVDANSTGASYTYHSGSPATAGNELVSSTVSPATTTTYYILADNSGCTDELAVTVTVNPLPDLSTVTTPAICNGSSYDLTSVVIVDANTTGASYTYHSGSPATAGNELASSSVSPSTTTTYYILGTTGSGCTDELAVTLTVNPLPNLSTVTTPAICNGSSYDLTSVVIVDANTTGASYTYHSGSPANAGNELASSTVSPSTTTTYYILGTTGSGCTDELAVMVTVNPLPDLSTVTTPAICNGSSYDLTSVVIVDANTTGASYTYHSGSPATAGNELASSSVSPSTTTTYYILGTTGSGCTDELAVTVTVNPLPDLSTITTPAICNGSSYDLTSITIVDANTTGASYTYHSGSPATAGNELASSTVSPSTTTTYYILGTTGSGCTDELAVTVTVNPLPDLSTVTTPAICNGSGYDLTSVVIVDANTTGASYTYHSGSPATAGNELASSTVSPSTTTTYYILGTTGSGCTDELAVTVTVNPLPDLSTITVPAICNGGSYDLTSVAIVDANTTGASYTYHSGSPATAGNELASSTVSPSTTTTYYILGTTGSGCTDELSVTVTVNVLPNISTITTPAICNGSSYDLTTVVIVDANTTGANYTYHSGSPATAGNELASSTVSPTTTTTYYILADNSGCTDELAITVTVNPLPDLSTVTAPAICNGGSYDLTTVAIVDANTTGASYTYHSGSPATAGNELASSTVSPSTTTTYYILGTTGSGCTDELAVTVTVNPLPDLSTITAPSICNGGSYDLTSVAIVDANTTGASYTYHSGSPATAGNELASSTVSPSATTTYYILGTTGSGCTDELPVTLTVNPLPDLSTTTTPAICNGSSYDLTSVAIVDANTTGASYTYHSGSPATAGNELASSTVSPSTTTTYYILGTTGSGCTDELAIDVTVTPGLPADAGAIAGSNNACQGETGVNYSINSIARAVSYEWSFTGTGATITPLTDTTVSIDFASNATGGNLQVVARNLCGLGNNSIQPIALNPGVPADAGIITGSDNACQGATGIAYSIDPVANAASYTWTYSGTGATIIGSGNSVSINFDVSATTGTLSVKAINSCGEGAASTFDITLYDGVPDAAGAITGSNSVCQGQSGINYNASSINKAAAYNWSYSGTGVTIVGSGTTIALDFAADATSGTLTVKGANNCGEGAGSTINITVNSGAPSAAGVISGVDNVCQGENGVSYSITSILNATNYEWTYSGSGVTINGSGTTISLDFSASASSGTLTVQGVNGCGIGTESSIAITVSTGAAAAAGDIIGQNNVCQGETSVSYSIPEITDATSYEWTYSGTGTIINGSGTTITIDFDVLATSGSLTVLGRNSCGSGISSSFPITVSTGNPEAAGTIAGTEKVCQDVTGINYNVPEINGAVQYIWNYTGTGVTISSTDNSAIIDYGDSASSGVLMVTGSNSCGLGESSAPYAIKVNRLPVNAGVISGRFDVCAGEKQLEYTVDSIEGASVYAWAFTGSGEAITGFGNRVLIDFGETSSSGTLTVSGRNECGDGMASTDQQVTVKSKEECAETALGEISNVFTPNDDGFHDTWQVNNIELFPNAGIEVFDRWGRKVFKTENGYNNDWDGTQYGKPLIMDNYFYIIDLFGDGKKILKGSLTIIK